MVGLVLEGGGTKGAYQVGAYQAFLDCNIKIDGVVGTSIGSFNAAMIAAGEFEKLKSFWLKENMGLLLGFNELSKINRSHPLANLQEMLVPLNKYIETKGIPITILKNKIYLLLDEEKVRTSTIDYGLVTYRLNDQRLLYLFKEDIPKHKLVDYICASCFLPVFKFEKLDGENYYIDGGFYDNSPSNMLDEKGYEKIYIISLKAPGVSAKKNDKSKIVTISPSRYLGSILNTNLQNIEKNIEMGYYDTLKVLKNYDGYKFLFAKRPKWFYNIMVRKVSSRTLRRIESYFFTRNKKTLILKSIEYVLLKEKVKYGKIYNPEEEIRRIKKIDNDMIVYKFLKELKIFL